MDNLLSVVMSNLTAGFKGNTSMTGTLSLAEFMSQGMTIESGETLLLNISDNNSLLITNVKGEKIVVPPETLSVDKNIPLNNTEPVALEVKVGTIQNQTAKIQILNINGQEPGSYVRAQQSAETANISESSPAAVIKDISNPQNIPLQTLNLEKTVRQEIQNLPLPPQQKEQLQTALQQVEIKLQVSRLSEDKQMPMIAPENSAVVAKVNQNLAQIPQMLNGVTQPQEQAAVIQNTVENIIKELTTFIGEKLPAVVGDKGFVTELGNVPMEIPLQLPEGLVAELKIVDILFQAQQSPEVTLSPSPLEKMSQSIQQLQKENPQVYQKIIEKLPADNEKMLSNMVMFSKAAAKGDVHQWLGQEIVQQLENQGQTGRAVLNDLQNALQNSNRQTPQWRIIEIPYYVDNQLEKIKLAVKEYPQEDKEENQQQKFGTRFVVDTNFSQLGAFQFDGFSMAKDRRFDLIIRTQNSIDDDLYANIIRIFKTTLNDVNYSGNVKINLKENFIKISENNNSNFLNEGLFV